MTFPCDPKDGKPAEEIAAKDLSLVLSKDQLFSFYPLLQCGFFIKVKLGCTVRELLTDEFGLDERYIAERLTTIFLDGKPVDNIDSAIVESGAILALSSAMPGLVGAVMRRGGLLSSLRSSISYKEGSPRHAGPVGFIRVKLFNITMNELGPLFLGRGIIAKKSDVFHVLEGIAADLRQNPREAYLGEEPIDPVRLIGKDWSYFKEDYIHLRIVTEDPEMDKR